MLDEETVCQLDISNFCSMWKPLLISESELTVAQAYQTRDQQVNRTVQLIV